MIQDFPMTKSVYICRPMPNRLPQLHFPNIYVCHSGEVSNEIESPDADARKSRHVRRARGFGIVKQ